MNFNEGFTPLEKVHPVRDKSLTGFTLIETIVVMTIFSIIAAGIVSSFMSGMKIWGRAREVNFAQNEAILTLEIISHQLRQSVNVSAVGFRGEKEEFSFPTILGNAIVKVTYKFDAASKYILQRQELLRDIIARQENEDDAKKDIKYTEKKFLRADNFSLSYLEFDKEEKNYEWVDTWGNERAEDKDAGIFSAVKLEVGWGGHKVTKTVFIPIADYLSTAENKTVITQEGV